MAVFIGNGIGVNSIEDGDLIPDGWSIITEAEARKANPDLFGAEKAVEPKPVAKKSAPKTADK